MLFPYSPFFNARCFHNAGIERCHARCVGDSRLRDAITGNGGG